MSIFGKNNGEEQPTDEFEGGDDFEKDGGLTASRSDAAPKSAKKSGALIGALGVVLLGLGGGYFYLTSQGDTPAMMPPPDVPADSAALVPDMAVVPGDAIPMGAENVTDAVTAPDAMAQAGLDAGLPAMPPMPGDATATDTTVITTTTVTETAPVDAAALVDPLSADPAIAIDPTTGLPVAPAADATVTTTTVVTETAVTDPASVPVPTDSAQSVADVLGAPPLDDASVEDAPMPADVTTTTTVTEATTADAASIEQTTVTTVTEQPPVMPDAAAVTTAAASSNDLPMPADAAAVTTTTVTTETTAVATTTPPTEGEMAIVQNSGMIDAVTDTGVQTTTTTTTVTPDVAAIANAAAVQDAMIRPLPNHYLVVKKNNNAGDVDARLTAARTALQQGRTTAALQLFDEIYVDYPKDKRVLMGRALALQKLGQNSQALTAYESVLINEPQNLDALTNMLGLLKKENPQLAIDKLSQLRDAYPFNADITAQLGIAHADAGDLTQGLKYLEMSDALKPGNSYVTFNKAVLFDKMGRTAEAAELYRQILRMAADGKLDQQLPLEVIRRRLSVLR